MKNFTRVGDVRRIVYGCSIVDVSGTINYNDSVHNCHIMRCSSCGPHHVLNGWVNWKKDNVKAKIFCKEYDANIWEIVQFTDVFFNDKEIVVTGPVYDDEIILGHHNCEEMGCEENANIEDHIILRGTIDRIVVGKEL